MAKRACAIALLAVAALMVSGCSPRETTDDFNLPSRSQAVASPTSAPDETASLTPAGDHSTSTPDGNAPHETAEPISLAGIEAAVTADLASALGVSVERIQVTEAVEQTWPDQGLGCTDRKGVLEAAPVSGYRIILAYGGETYRYHADQAGNYVRCLESGKPLGPIIKK